jgi:hypothetical protein
MTVALPAAGIAVAEPRYIDRGGILEAALGGPDQRLDRLGSKWGAAFSTRPMKAEEARVWISRLTRGRSDPAQIKFPQPGIINEIGHNGSLNGAVAANSISINVNIHSANNGKKVKEGQFIALIRGGQRYIYQVSADSIVSAGLVGLTLWPPIRTAMSNVDVVEFLNPLMEGYVKGDQTTWTIDNAKIFGLSFEIEEVQ